MTDTAVAASRRTISRVLVLSGSAEMGCTSVAANTAVAAAVTGTATLLIDATQGEVQSSELVHGPGQLALLPRTTQDEIALHWDTPPPSLGDPLLVICDAGGHDSTLAESADHVVVVTNTEPASLDDAYGCIKRLAFLRGLDGVGIVINRAGNAAQAAAQADRIATLTEHFLGLRLPLFGWLPESSEVGRAALVGSAFVLESVDCPATKLVQTLAESFIPHFAAHDLPNETRNSQ